MRFHHSTRRGRSRLAYSMKPYRHSSLANWSKLGYCPQTNIHFNRRLPVAPPADLLASPELLQREQQRQQQSCLQDVKQIDQSLNRLTLRPLSVKTEEAPEEIQAKNKLKLSPGDLEALRQHFLSKVERHMFWSNKAARRMRLTSVEERHVYVLELISYCQRRDLEWRYEPFRAGLSSAPTLSSRPFASQPSTPLTPEQGSMLKLTRSLSNRSDGRSGRDSSLELRPPVDARLVWSIVPSSELQPDGLSSAGHSQCEIPDSSFVKSCHGCNGRGRHKCNACQGLGYEVCNRCSGRGMTKHIRIPTSNRRSFSNELEADPDEEADRAESGSKRDSAIGWPSATGWSASTEDCLFCHGAGQKRCWVCAGKTYKTCSACEGATKLRCYLSLNISWLHHRNECILNNSDQIIPNDKLAITEGLPLIDRLAEPCLRPLEPSELLATVGQPEEAAQLAHASRRLAERHRLQYRDERFLKQRHKLTQIECHKVHFEWKKRSGHFVIYGSERKVYIAKYPFKTICNIS